jgi:hypothetical protein
MPDKLKFYERIVSRIESGKYKQRVPDQGFAPTLRYNAASFYERQISGRRWKRRDDAAVRELLRRLNRVCLEEMDVDAKRQKEEAKTLRILRSARRRKG